MNPKLQFLNHEPLTRDHKHAPWITTCSAPASMAVCTGVTPSPSTSVIPQLKFKVQSYGFTKGLLGYRATGLGL